MSASKTNLDKQKRRHFGPLIGITLALLVAGGLLFGYMVYTADTEDAAPATQIQTDDPSTLPAQSTPATPLEQADPAPSVIAPAPTPDPAPAPAD